MMTKSNKFSIEQVVTLDIDSQGNVTQRLTDLETTLGEYPSPRALSGNQSCRCERAQGTSGRI